MALVPFTIYQGASKKTVSVSGIVTAPGTLYTVDTSPVVANSTGLDSIHLNVLFSNILPDPEQATQKGWRIRAVIETEGAGNPPNWWNPVGHMFEPLGDPGQGLRHVVVIQPNLVNLFEGVPLDLSDPLGNITRLSKQQGVLLTDFRVRLEVSDQFAGGLGALESFDVEIFGDMYDHV